MLKLLRFFKCQLAMVLKSHEKIQETFWICVGWRSRALIKTRASVVGQGLREDFIICFAREESFYIFLDFRIGLLRTPNSYSTILKTRNKGG